MNASRNIWPRWFHLDARLTMGALAALALVSLPALRAAPAFEEADAAAFTDRYCSSCHNDVDKKGRLDLTRLAFDPNDSANLAVWVKVHDRIEAGEMPPRKKVPIASMRHADDDL